VAFAGNLIWARPMKEVRSTKTQSGGKGTSGPSSKSVTYSYYGRFAVGVCEGPIAQFGKIWADGKLIRDAGGSTFALAPGTRYSSGLADHLQGDTGQRSLSRRRRPAAGSMVDCRGAVQVFGFIPSTDIALRCRQGLLVIRNRSFAVDNVANSSRRMAPTSERAACHDTRQGAGGRKSA
jgi:hypothetical protein